SHEVRVGQEAAAYGDCVRHPAPQNLGSLLARCGLAESAIEYQTIRPQPSQLTEDLLRRGCTHMQVGQPQLAQMPRQDEIRFVVVITNVVLGVTRRNPHTHSVSTYLGGGGMRDFDDDPGTVGGRSTVCVDAVIGSRG